ncbi:MAG: deferrochelatase/peroxidase EfeB [Actinomycetales bacterium]|nr:deferrochelatase/peroxidase EfeB [Actinomycetales bacterium]
MQIKGSLSEVPNTRLSRRSLLAALGVTGAAAAATAVASTASAGERRHGHDDRPRPDFSPGSPTRAFFGPHQSGIADAPQSHLAFASFNLTVEGRAALRTLLQDWTAAASAMTSGLPIGRATTGADAVPTDTGEALDLPAAALTITVGFGPTLFRDARGRDRYGIAAQHPSALAAIPAFTGDALDPRRVGGDLCIQACADDPQVAQHAVRSLQRVAGERASLQWTQLGFNRSAVLSSVTTTPRNLFGFRDGTNNISTQDNALMDQHVWAQAADGAPWMAGGSYLTVRRIRMLTTTWDEEPLAEQERVFGRRKGDGAPLSGGSEFTTPNFHATGTDGKPLIDPDSHMAAASPANNGGIRILRRAFSYADPLDAKGVPDMGLFFMAYQRDIGRQFIPLQRRLAAIDLMNEYVQHTASASFAVPAGVRGPGDYWGSALLG